MKAEDIDSRSERLIYKVPQLTKTSTSSFSRPPLPKLSDL